MGGIGRIYRRGKKGIFWIAFYRRGKEIRETSGSTNEKIARRLLSQWIAEIFNTESKLRGIDDEN